MKHVKQTSLYYQRLFIYSIGITDDIIVRSAISTQCLSVSRCCITDEPKEESNSTESAIQCGKDVTVEVITYTSQPRSYRSMNITAQLFSFNLQNAYN